ncbi:hypothetical protein HDU89_000834 [Geranomyces variabilis]|nr:hypothetical protein HDU89_000834 [Geranomyces variabilis]
MKSAGISDSDSGSNAKLPLPAGSPNRTQHPKTLRSARRLATSPRTALLAKDGSGGVNMLLDADGRKNKTPPDDPTKRPHTTTSASTLSSTDSSRQPTPFTPPSQHHRPRSRQISRAQHPDFFTLDVGTLTGRFEIQVHAQDEVGDVKRRIQESEGIPIESQILVWREKALADDASPIGAYGIQDGSRLQLVLHMCTGPGPPMKMKEVAKDEDPVVLLLCKEDDDMYMLEFHMTDLKDRKPDHRRLLQLAELAGLEVFHDLSASTSNLLMSSLQRQEDDMEEEEAQRRADDMERQQYQYQDSQDRLDRPDTGDSGGSTGSFHTLDRASSVGSAASVRPLSPLSDATSSRPSSGESAMQDLLRDVLGLQAAPSYRARAYPRTARRRIRPATAISVMRIPGGAGPMIIIPKTRPASAVQLAKRRSVMDDTPPATPPAGPAPGSARRDSGDGVSVLCTRPRPPSQTPARAYTARSRPCSSATRREKRRSYSPSSYVDAVPSTQLGEHVNEFTSVAMPGRVSRVISTATGRRYASGVAGGSNHGSSGEVNKMDGTSGGPSNGNPRPRSKRESARPIPPRTSISSVITSRRCYLCKKKVGPATSFKCRCNQVFCSVHRYSDRHSCSFDYKGAGKVALAKENPVVKKEKLEKI